MKHQSLDAIVASGPIEEVQAPLTRADLLRIAQRAFRGREEESFVPFRNVERRPLWLLRLRSTRRTPFAPVLRALNHAGVPVKPRIGAIMDALGLTKEDVHKLCFCECLNGKLTGRDLGRYFKIRADQLSGA